MEGSPLETEITCILFKILTYLIDTKNSIKHRCFGHYLEFLPSWLILKIDQSGGPHLEF